MKGTKRAIAVVLLCAVGLGGLPGCTSPRGGLTLVNLLLGVGASVGGYFLARELAD